MPELRLLAHDPPSLADPALLDCGVVAFSIDEVAVILRVNRKTVTAMIDRGELAEVRYARRRWVPAHVLRAFLLLEPPVGPAAEPSRT
jgi:excisionase family DNA binding protein